MPFVRSGYVYSGHGSLRDAGGYSYYWLSYAYPGSSQDAYYLDFSTADVTPAFHAGRVYGFSSPAQFTIYLRNSPMSFVRSGYVYSGYGSLRYAGDNSYYWSSYASPGSSQLAYGLFFNTADVGPAYHNARVLGFSATTSKTTNHTPAIPHKITKHPIHNRARPKPQPHIFPISLNNLPNFPIFY